MRHAAGIGLNFIDRTHHGKYNELPFYFTADCITQRCYERVGYPTLLQVKDEDTLLQMSPDFPLLKTVESRGVIVTCKHTSGKFSTVCE